MLHGSYSMLGWEISFDCFIDIVVWCYYWQAARSTYAVFKLLTGQFWGFCPAGATHCTSGVKFGMEKSSMPIFPNFAKFHRQISPRWCRGSPQSEDFMEFWNINASQGAILCTILQNFEGLLAVPSSVKHLNLGICSVGPELWFFNLGCIFPQIFGTP